MNPYLSPSITPASLVHTLYGNRRLIYALTRRDVFARYEGSLFGLVWTLVHPVLMLAVYTFVFSVVFSAKWTSRSESKTEFALALFAGLMIFNLFSECINKAPSIVLSNANYVKKVVFPLEVLSVVSMGTALFHFFSSFLVWSVFYFAFFGVPYVTILMLPLVLLNTILLTIGFSWFLAAFGVFVRDVSQIIGVVVTVLLFLSPIFYPLSVIPEEYHAYIKLSPITFMVEQGRDLMMFGRPMQWDKYLINLFVCVAFFWAGYAWFQKTRRGFADVL